jgi:uncharacterized protein (DUF1778 family)
MWTKEDSIKGNDIIRHNIRINYKISTKINNNDFEIIEKAILITGQNLSEFVKMAALKEAKLTVLEHSQEIRESFKDMIKEEIEEYERLTEFDKQKDQNIKETKGGECI